MFFLSFWVFPTPVVWGINSRAVFLNMWVMTPWGVKWFLYLCTHFKEQMAKTAHKILEDLKTGPDKLLSPMLYSVYFI